MVEINKDEELLVAEEQEEVLEEVDTPEELVEEAGEEASEETVQNEVEEQQTPVYYEEEQPAVVTKDYSKKIKLVYKLLALLAFVSAFVAIAGLSGGLVVCEDLTFSSQGMTDYITYMITLLTDQQNNAGYTTPAFVIPMALCVAYAVFYIVYMIILLINIIILFFQFFGMIFARKEVKIKYSKFSKRALTFSSLSMAFMAACLMYPQARLTQMGVIVLVLAGVIYLGTNVAVVMFKHLEEQKVNWNDCLLDLSKPLVLLAVIVLFFVAFGKFNVLEIAERFWYIADNMDTVVNGTLAFVSVLDLWLVTKACKLGRIALKHYALDNGKKPVNNLLRKKSITLIVLTILVLAARLFLTGVLVTKDYVNSVLAYKDTYLIFIVGAFTLLCCLKTEKKQKEEIIRE